MIKQLLNMLNRLLFLLLLCLGLQTLSAQDLVDCNVMLEDSREAYDAGMVELVPDLLLECIKTNGLSGEAKKEAYKLVINSYLFDYMSAEADSLMDDFVLEFPNYRSLSSDPQEFIALLDTHLIAIGIDPTEMPADTIDTGRKNFIQRFKERTITKGAGEYGNTLGYNVGIPLTLPITLEGYSAGDPTQDDGHFGLLPGIMAGAELNLILNRKFEASFGLIYDLSRFSYSASPMSSVSYRYVESQHQVLVPLSVMYKFNPESRKICYYLRGGIIPSYLIYASGKGTRTAGDAEEELVVDPTGITASRVNLNLDALLGGGIRIPLNNAFIFAELRLSSRLVKANQEDMRYENNDLTWLLYHIDSDFRVNKISICGGICWDLTKE
jgi:hypothetical protein